jgi:[acyl-carrier-protein] S-malonyltransferase
VVKARGEAMQAAAEKTAGAMVSVLGLEVPDVEAIVREARAVGPLEIANLLCPGNTVVSGSVPAIEKVEAIGAARGGIRMVRLAVAGAFHTDLMKPADEALAMALDGVTISAPRIPVWSNVDAKPHTDPAEIKALLVKQVLSPVRWEETLRGFVAGGIDRYYELGPNRHLAGMLKRVNRKADMRNITV